MTPGGRLAAAIEVLEEIAARHRPVPGALKDWGVAHRFAGSSDRAAIAALVGAALRRRASAAWAAGEDTPRGLALGALRLAWGLEAEEIAGMATGERFDPPPLSDAERAALGRADPLGDAPPCVRADVPAWLWPSFEAVFGDRAEGQGAALAARPPLDLRVNTLKTTRDKALNALQKFGAHPTPLSPVGLRIAAVEGPARLPHVESDPAHGRGWFEVQDEGSQVAALMCGARAGHQVADLCAGAGGKTLGLAAAMENRGQVFAHDADARRLRPIFERLKRAGARNVQVRGAGESLADLEARMDIVLVDAPCTGSGVWRRRPDAKWRLKPEALAARRAEQAALLAEAAPLVRPGGRLVYVTCSVFAEENQDQVAAFLAGHGDFAALDWRPAWDESLGTAPPDSAAGEGPFLLLAPASHGTDGFFVAIVGRAE